MFDALLESRSKSERFAGGAIASVAAHAVFIAAAVFATAQARVSSPDSFDVVRTIHFPPQPASAPTTRTSTQRKRVVDGVLPPPIDTRRIDVNVPPIDVSGLTSKPIDFPTRPIGGAEGGHVIGAGSTPEGPFQADQVEKQASFIRGSASPSYPEVLRNSGVEGEAVALFVVDETGRAETDSVRFLRSDNELFEDAVRVALPRMRFTPAEIGGRKVRQLVQMPFVFTIRR